MRITFVQRQIFALPGIASMIGNVIRHGHTADVVIENAEKQFEQVLSNTDPDVVGITITSSDINWLVEVLPWIKRSAPAALILVGGIHPTIHPTLIDEYPEIDAICVGEGEEAVVELLGALQASSSGNQLSVISDQSGKDGKRLAVSGEQSGKDSKQLAVSSEQSASTGAQLPLTVPSPLTAYRLPLTSIKNLHIRWKGQIYRNAPRPLITNLDAYPENREAYFKRYPQLAQDTLLQFISSRGCPYTCSFCVNEKLNRIFHGLGPVHRRKSVEFSIKELKHLLSLYPNAATGFFIDDLFLFNRRWVKEFLPRFKEEIGLPYICSAGPRTIDDEMADLLKETGCASVEFGVETGNEERRKEIFNKGAFTDDEFRRQIGLVKSRGIEVYAPCMFVFPTETIADAFRTVEFYHELEVDHPFSSFLMPFPDTEIYEIAIKYGVIPDDLKAEDLPGNYFLNSTCDIPERRVIENIQYLFYFFVKFPWFYHSFRWLVFLPIRLKLIRYAGLFFWFKNWKMMTYRETISYFWRYRKAQ
jgi:radical SAM superfamily enzyme YgiQ (UPF0313 family)